MPPTPASTMSMGRDHHWVGDLAEALAEDDHHGQFVKGQTVRQTPFTRSDMVLSSDEWHRKVVGKVSDWIDVEHDVARIRRNSEDALAQELKWTIHLGNPAVVVPLKSSRCANLASILSPYLSSAQHTQFWIRVPLTPPSEHVQEEEAQSVNATPLDLIRSGDPWEWWNSLRTFMASSTRVGVVLDVTANLPSESRLDRWVGEPIKAIILPTSIFLRNAKGFPVLSKAHQRFLHKLFKLSPQLILSGNNNSPHGYTAFLKYLAHLQAKQPPKDPVMEFAAGYEDYLEYPLQPLMDNLESQTYETFEKDPVKYAQYQAAAALALTDLKETLGADRDIVVMVVGAGRGPLVRRVLAAAESVKVPVKVYAVEKNPNAVVTLRTMKEEEWGARVTVVSCDMRQWDAPEQADMLVSELLGSWGDNELSPECLDGAQRFLRPNGISIPASYTSSVAPVSCHKLHSDIVAHEKPKHLETTYVVMLHNHVRLSEPEDLFRFEHPNAGCETEDGPDNTRFRRVRFQCTEAGTMHGFGGYFESVLYKDISISIRPETHSPGMFSWFPLYIPVRRPIYVGANQVVEACFWRKTSPTKVWYEWTVTSPVQTEIHNLAAGSSFVGL